MLNCKVALIGAGYTAREHIRAFNDIPGVSLSGIYSRTRSRAESLASEFNIPNICDSVDELYNKTQADLVVITVVELAMNAVSKCCLEFPWTLLLEKPPGYNLEDAHDIQNAVVSKSRKVFVALNRRFYSTTGAAINSMSDSSGRRFIKVQDQQDLARALAAGQPVEVVENWMYANSIHTIDYLRVFGRGKVKAVENIIPWEAKSPGVVLSRVDFESGDIGLYEGIWHAPGPWAVSITTPGKRWELRPLEQLNVQDLGQPVQQWENHPWDSEFKPGYRKQAEELAKVVRGEPSGAVALSDGLETMELIAQIFRN